MKSFENQTKEAWRTKAITDLKGKPITDLNIAINEEVILEPMYTADEELSAASVRWNPHQKGWLNGLQVTIDQIDETAIRQINQNLLEALAGGIESLYLSLPTMDASQIEQLLANIYLEMITMRVHCDDATTSALTAVIENYASNKALAMEDIVAQINPTEIDLPISQDNDLQLADGLQKLTQVLAEGMTWSQVVLRVSIGNHLFKEVAKLRALKLLVYAIADDLNKPLDRFPIIQAVVAHQAVDQELEVAIEWTNKATIAAFAGVDEIIISRTFDTAFPINEKDKARLSRAVHALLKLESNLDQHKDIFYGSYWMEKATQEIFVNTWKKIKGGES